MRPQYSIVTQPTQEPVSIDEIMQHVRVDSTDDMTYLAGLIPVAREYVEGQTCRSACKTTWKVTASRWDDLFRDSHSQMRVPDTFTDPRYGLANLLQDFIIPIFRYPLVSVSSVKYHAPDASELTTMSAADYRVVTDAEPGIIQLIDSAPAIHNRVDAVQITFVAGVADTPASMSHAIKMLVAHLYENRVPISMGGSAIEIPYTLQALITHQKSSGFF